MCTGCYVRSEEKSKSTSDLFTLFSEFMNIETHGAQEVVVRFHGETNQSISGEGQKRKTPFDRSLSRKGRRPKSPDDSGEQENLLH